MPGKPSQNERYLRAAAEFGAALERLARAYEIDVELRRDLLQDIHVALWRSMERFDGRCSERSWVYRVAHNVGASRVRRRHRNARERLTTLDELSAAAGPASDDPEVTVADRRALTRLMTLIHSLAPVDRQVMLLYLEGFDAAAISEITGFSPGAARPACGLSPRGTRPPTRCGKEKYVPRSSAGVAGGHFDHPGSIASVSGR